MCNRFYCVCGVLHWNSMSVLDFFEWVEWTVVLWMSAVTLCFIVFCLVFLKPVPAGSCRCVHDNRINRFVYWNIMLPLSLTEHWEIKTACRSMAAFVKQCDCVFVKFTQFHVHRVSVCRSWSSSAPVGPSMRSCSVSSHKAFDMQGCIRKRSLTTDSCFPLLKNTFHS